MKNRKEIARRYYQKNKEKIRTASQKYYQRNREKILAYNKKHRKEINRKAMERYRTDPEFRARRKESMRKTRKKAYQKQKLGDYDKIKEICKLHGFSDDVCEAIALNGNVLDKKLAERGISNG